MSGLRERNKEQRRRAILDAALELLRVNDIRAVTIEQIAARAEVSPPTVYNLVGTREQLLVTLVDQISQDLATSFSPAEGEQGDPIAVARRGLDQSVAAFVADSAAYRQIVRSLGDLAVSGTRLTFDPVDLHIRTMRRAQELGILRADLDPVALGRQSLLTYTAALMSWAAGNLSDDDFAVAAHHGMFTVLSAAASDAHREELHVTLAELGRALAAVSWSRP